MRPGFPRSSIELHVQDPHDDPDADHERDGLAGGRDRVDAADLVPVDGQLRGGDGGVCDDKVEYGMQIAEVAFPQLANGS
jgi:hypothetical protein